MKFDFKSFSRTLEYLVDIIIIILIGVYIFMKFTSNDSLKSDEMELMNYKGREKNLYDGIIKQRHHSFDSTIIWDFKKRDTFFVHDTGNAKTKWPIDSLDLSWIRKEGSLNNNKLSATLGYHYSPVMNIHETQEINVFLSANGTKSAIRDTLIKILKDEDPDRNPADTGKIEFKEHVPLYKFVTMDLSPLDSGIIIRKVPDAARQQVDTSKGNKWSWVIFANSAEKSESKLLLTVFSEDPSHLEKRYIHIKIGIEKNPFRIFYNYLIQHPADFLFKIIVPFLTFVGGVLWGKRKKNKNSREPDKDENKESTD